jgi:hypothetical protein
MGLKPLPRNDFLFLKRDFCYCMCIEYVLYLCYAGYVSLPKN